MASNNGYSITISPVRIGKGTRIFPDDSMMSNTEKQLICLLHNSVNGRYVSCSSRELLRERFDGNIFFVCLESGAVFFSFVPEKSDVTAEGAFIGMKDLKTAWKLFLPYLVYLFVSGASVPNDTFTMDFFKFKEQAEKIKNDLPADKREYADAVIRKLRTGAGPFSFYSARFPSSMILGSFENITPEDVNISPININSGIVFDHEAVMREASLIRNKKPDLVNIRFCRTTPKRYKELRKAEIKKYCLKQYQREMMKKIEDFDTSLKNVWFFSCNEKYYISIDNDIAREIEKNDGMIPFDVLYKQMSIALGSAENRMISYKIGTPKIVGVKVIESFEETMEKIERQKSLAASNSVGASGSTSVISYSGHNGTSKQTVHASEPPQACETKLNAFLKEKWKRFLELFKKSSDKE